MAPGATGIPAGIQSGSLLPSFSVKRGRFGSGCGLFFFFFLINLLTDLYFQIGSCGLQQEVTPMTLFKFYLFVGISFCHITVTCFVPLLSQ